MQDVTNAAASIKSNIDLKSISNLSQAMDSSLNLAPIREASGSTLETLATVSSNMRNMSND